MIDQFAKELFSNIQSQAQGVKDLSESQLKATIEAAMRKLNMVSREEFDAQQAVLLRTREKLEALETQFEAFQSSLNDNKKAEK